MTEDEFNTIAWRDFIMFAWKERDIWKAFTAETGIPHVADRPATPIERLIDKVTGADDIERIASAFIEWVTRNHWGIDNAPKVYRDQLETRAIAKLKER